VECHYPINSVPPVSYLHLPITRCLATKSTPPLRRARRAPIPHIQPSNAVNVPRRGFKITAPRASLVLGGVPPIASSLVAPLSETYDPLLYAQPFNSAARLSPVQLLRESCLPISCFLPESIDKCFMFYHPPSAQSHLGVDASEWSREEVIMLPGKAEAVDAVVH